MRYFLSKYAKYILCATKSIYILRIFRTKMRSLCASPSPVPTPSVQLCIAIAMPDGRGPYSLFLCCTRSPYKNGWKSNGKTKWKKKNKNCWQNASRHIHEYCPHCAVVARYQASAPKIFHRMANGTWLTVDALVIENESNEYDTIAAWWRMSAATARH